MLNVAPHSETTENPKVVIIGAGFGGLSAAKELAGKPFDVTLIDQHNYHLFQPLLYQVATAGLAPSDIAAPIRGILSPRLITGLTGSRVENMAKPQPSAEAPQAMRNVA
jgi:NADH dehydrogenase FAD-containing subunit